MRIANMFPLQNFKLPSGLKGVSADLLVRAKYELAVFSRIGISSADFSSVLISSNWLNRRGLSAERIMHAHFSLRIGPRT